MDYTLIDAVIAELLSQHGEELKGKKSPGFIEPMLAVGSEGARFIETIVSMTKPLSGLEIGTSSGFSALAAMRGALDTDFRLVTVDFDPAKAVWAKENFRRAGVGDRIEVIVKDALDAVKNIKGKFDYVLLDAAKSQNLPLMRLLLPLLNEGAVVLTDNIYTHRDALADFLEFVRKHDLLTSGLMEIGNGIELTIKMKSRLTRNIVPGDIL